MLRAKPRHIVQDTVDTLRSVQVLALANNPGVYRQAAWASLPER